MGKQDFNSMWISRCKRILLGEPLSYQSEPTQGLPKWKALSVLASDAFSSVAYATEEILIPLAAISAAATAWSMPIALAIAALLLIVTASYRQTLDSYPSGGGAYLVSRDHLGVLPSLVAGASLLVDYVLTVAVSVSASSAALVSAYPGLRPWQTALAVILTGLISLANLRGLRKSASWLSLPTYLFLGSMFYLIGQGAWNVLHGIQAPVAPIVHEYYPELSLLLIFRAFSSGCAALTGIEGISQSTLALQPPVQKNAKSTLAWMGVVLGSLFLGVTLLAHVFGIVPTAEQTVLSSLARSVFGDSRTYYVIQASTALVLLSAANTAFLSFPRLASQLANDRYLPRQFASIGDRLVFSNAITGLSIAAMFLVVIFRAQTHALVPLYAVGVFLSFTLSQAAMVVHHWKRRKPGRARSLFLHGVGGLTTGVVFAVISLTKFTHGAWMVFVLLAAMVWTFLRIHDHYLCVGRELSLIGQDPPKCLGKLQHTVIVPVSGIHRGVLDALRYALSISDDVRACYVELDPQATERIQQEWNHWAHEIPFVILKSPYRSVIGPVLEYINDVEKMTHNDVITVIIPEFVTTRLWHRLLHNQTAFLIRASLLFRRGIVVTNSRYHLSET